MRWIAILAFFLVLTGSALANSSDEEYLDIYNEILQADSLLQAGHSDSAALRYLQAQADLAKLQKEHPLWNPDIVKFRFDYLAEKIQSLEKYLPNTNAPPAAAPAPVQPVAVAPVNLGPSVAALQQQNAGLQEQVRSLNSANSELEGKLKEALAVQPAAVSPDELAKAQARIVLLQKERDLLSVALDQEKTANASTISAAANQAVAELKARAAAKEKKSQEELAAAKEAAAESDRKLAAVSKDLEEMKEAHAAELAHAKEAAAGLESKLAVANKELESQKTESAAELAHAKEAAADLESKLAAANKELESLKSAHPPEVQIAEGTKQIPEESDRLKQLLAAVTKDEATIAQLKEAVAEAEKKLAEANSELDTLKATHPGEAPSAESTKAVIDERDKLKEQLAQRSKDLADAEAHHNQELLTVRTALQQAEQQRDELEKKLAAVPPSSPAQEKATGENPALSQRVELLKARIAVLEAEPVPYTPEELALLKKTPVPIPTNSLKAASADTTSAALTPRHVHSSKDLPPGSGALWEDALRSWRAGDFPAAELKYKDVLKQDPTNVYVLIFLANEQFAAGHLADCEKSLQTALAVDPEDAGCLYLLGLMRYRQNKPDEALDALSLSAKYNPTNAATQNFLGCVLADKGLRAAAETALRKSLQVDPDYPDAHFNLAVVYASEKPPSIELARWHYKKALALGHAKDDRLDKLLEEKPATQ